MQKKSTAYFYVHIIAVFVLFSTGFSSVAAEKGLVEGNIITVAGSKGGLDTALVVKPSHPDDFANPDPSKRMVVLEILALPRQG